ncbi:DUF5107 domain-containing protein [Candidatus Latescibacterota bacterium]
MRRYQEDTMAMFPRLARRASSAALLVLTVLIAAVPAPAEVRAWEDEVTIPTYPLGPEDSYPVFAAFGRRNIYPYAMQTDLAHEKRDVTHRVLRIENEHLRLTVLPDLGGRLYSLYDRDAEREVFYRNRVIKPGLVGQRGAWISGGIEYNFPTGHTVTGFSPVLGRVRRNDDGSASIVVGDIEKVTRMAWSVTLTLHPGVAALQQDVHLYNRTTEPHRYYFWSNSAFPARPQTRFISPARYQTDHGGDYVFSWPVHDGVDISWDHSHTGSTSYFGLEVPQDFFGAYDHEADAGLVHVADHREVPGKKFWTWGTGASSQRWVEILTDDDGQYIEVQTGRFWNQSTWKQLLPQQTVDWREWWYGVRGLGGFDYAEENGALSIRLESDRLHLGILPVRDLARGEVLVEREGRELARRKVKLTAARPTHVSLPVADTAGVVIRVLSAGREAIVFDPAVLTNPQRVEVGERDGERESDLAEITPDAILSLARQHLDEADFEAAEEALAAGLEIDPGHVGLLTALGFTELTQGLYGRAESRFIAALERDEGDPGALYGRAVAALNRGDLTETEYRLRGLFDDPVYGNGARLLTGQALMRAGRLRQAAGVFADGALRASHADKAAAYHAAALRSLGRPQEALAAAGAGLAANPLSSLLQAEDWLCRQQSPKARDDGGREPAGPWRHRDPDVLLEVVVDELAIGDYAAARAILRRGLLAPAGRGGGSAGRGVAADAPTDPASVSMEAHPIALYYLADTEARLGNGQVAAALGAVAGRAPTRDVFPFRVETLAVLDAALERHPQDAAAHYYRGNVLARHRRLDEALAAWQRSVELDSANPVAWRNVALARGNAGDEDGAVEACRQAIAAAPADIRLYSDLDELYRDMEADLDVRLTNITEGLRHGRDNDLATAAANLLAEAEHYQEAIDLLTTQQFDVWEGGYAIHSAWEAAHMGRGKEILESGDAQAALRHFLLAMEYPANLGVGRPENERLALPKYWAAKAYEALGQRDEAAAFYRQAAEEEYRRASPTQYYQGLALLALGRAGEAESVFGDMVEAAQRRRRGRRGSSGYSALLAGLGHHGLGEAARARELLQTFLDDPDWSTGRRARYVRPYLATVREIMGQ